MPVLIKKGLTRLVRTRRLLPLFKYGDVHHVPASQPEPVSPDVAADVDEPSWCERLSPTVKFQSLPPSRTLFSI